MEGQATEIETRQACIRCKVVKAPGKFAVNRRRRDGRNRVCKTCLAVASAERESALRAMPADERVTIRGFTSCSIGDITIETLISRRDEYIVLLGAAFGRWSGCDDQEEREAAREALIYRARQVLEAERRCKSCDEEEPT